MKFFCTKENLLSGVQIVQRAVSPRNPLPILSGILLRAENNYLKMIATDLELGIECTVPVTVLKEGSVVLPARYFSEFVRRLPDTKIEIEKNLDNNSIVIKYFNSEFNMHGFSSEEFPLLPNIEGENTFYIKQDLFRNMIKQVTFATSTDENKPIFNGCLMEINDSGLILVATDTHRLAYRKTNINNISSKEINVIIPGKTLNELGKILDNDDEELKISITESQAVFEIEGVSLISRLIEGQFPNYNQVIPQNYKTRIKAKVKELLEALERASLLTKEGPNVVKLTIEGNNLIINSTAPEIGQIREEMPVETEGEDLQIAFNSRYLIDVLKFIDTEEINLELSGSLSPGIVKPVDSDLYIYLILPVRTV